MKTLIAVHHPRIAPKDKIAKITGDYTVKVFDSFDDLAEHLKNNSYDILCLDPDITHFDLPKDRLENFKGIKHLILHSTSVDYIDLKACVDLDIKVYPVPSYATDSTAEFALSMIFDGIRFKPLYDSHKNGLNMNLEVDYSALSQLVL